MTNNNIDSDRKGFIDFDFLLSPDGTPIRAVAESVYPFYLRGAMKRGENPVPHPMPVLDRKFLESHEGRWVRILAETTYAEVTMKKLGVNNTVVFFGSAQLPDVITAQKKLNEATEGNDLEEIARAEQVVEWSLYYEHARQLATRITRWSLDEGVEGEQDFMICTGGGPSIMEAGNRGAAEAGGKSVGLSIFLPHEQESNPYIDSELNFHFHYFFTRKFHFLYRAKALVVFPGGYGSLDELFEVLNLIKCRKIIKPMVVILYGSKFWRRLIDFDFMVEAGVIHKNDLEMISWVDSVDEAFKVLKKHLSMYLKQINQ